MVYLQDGRWPRLIVLSYKLAAADAVLGLVGGSFIQINKSDTLPISVTLPHSYSIPILSLNELDMGLLSYLIKFNYFSPDFRYNVSVLLKSFS